MAQENGKFKTFFEFKEFVDEKTNQEIMNHKLIFHSNIPSSYKSALNLGIKKLVSILSVDETNFQQFLTYNSIKFSDSNIVAKQFNKKGLLSEINESRRGHNFIRIFQSLKVDQYNFGFVRCEPTWDFHNIRDISEYCPLEIYTKDKSEQCFLRDLQFKDGRIKFIPVDSETELEVKQKLLKINLFMKNSQQKKKFRREKLMKLEEEHFRRIVGTLKRKFELLAEADFDNRWIN